MPWERYISQEERQKTIDELRLIYEYYNITREYQKIIILMLDNAPNQPSKFSRIYWVQTNNDSPGTFNTNCEIKFKTLMLKSSLCDYSNAHIVFKGTITVWNTAAAAADTNNK